MDSGGFSYQRSCNDGNERDQGGQKYSGQGESNTSTQKLNIDKRAKTKVQIGGSGAQDTPTCKKCRKTIRESVRLVPICALNVRCLVMMQGIVRMVVLEPRHRFKVMLLVNSLI